MWQLIIRNVFLAFTLLSFILYALISLFDLQYDDGSFGSIMFFIGIITGFIGQIVSKLMDILSINRDGFFIHFFITIAIAILLDRIKNVVFDKIKKN
jgi:uncharacterized membrane protein